MSSGVLEKRRAAQKATQASLGLRSPRAVRQKARDCPAGDDGHDTLCGVAVPELRASRGGRERREGFVHGARRARASSWTPPESVSTRRAPSMSCRRSRWPSGSVAGWLHHLWYTSGVNSPRGRRPILAVTFYLSGSGNEPVRDWLLDLHRGDRRTLGQDIKTAQYGWPLGMPLIRKLGPGLWEVRSHLASRRPDSDSRTCERSDRNGQEAHGQRLRRLPS